MRIIDGHIVIIRLESISGGLPSNLESLFKSEIGLCIGDAPETKLDFESNFRFNLENALKGMSIADGFTTFNLTHQSKEFTVKVTVSRIISHPKFQSLEDDNEQETSNDKKDDQKMTNKSSWNHLFTLLQYARAVSIKNRGSHHFKSYPNNDKSLDYAIACYARSFQLIQSVNLSSFILQSTSVQDIVNELRGVIDCCQWIDEFKLDIPTYDVYDHLPGLEFKTIMNISLCHLKRKNFQKCHKICTKALELRPVKEGCPTSIKKDDLSKAYYRRALCSFELGNYDEAKEDIIGCLDNSSSSNTEARELKKKITDKIDSYNNMLKTKLRKFDKVCNDPENTA